MRERLPVSQQVLGKIKSKTLNFFKYVNEEWMHIWSINRELTHDERMEEEKAQNPSQSLGLFTFALFGNTVL